MPFTDGNLFSIILSALYLSALCQRGNGNAADGLNVNSTIAGALNEKELVNGLLAGYGERSARPTRDSSAPIQVFFRYVLSALIALDESNQMITLKGVIRVEWTDEFLQWDPELNGGTQNITLKISEIWRPDITLSEDIEKDSISTPDLDASYVTVENSGAAVWFIPIITTSTCQMNIQFFPFDTQTCILTFLPWSLTDDRMRFFAKYDDDALQSLYVVNGVWTLTSFQAENVSIQYLCCPNAHDHARYTMKLTRQPEFFVTNMIIPALFLALLMLIGFWLHPDSGEKISFTVTNLLALILFQQLIADRMPPTGNPKSILVTCFSLLIFVGASAVFLTALMLSLYHHGDDSAPPIWAIKLLTPWFKKGAAKRFIRILLKHKHRSLGNGNSKKMSNGALSTDMELTNNHDGIYHIENTAATRDVSVHLPAATQETAAAPTMTSQEYNDSICSAWKQLAIAFDKCCGTVLGLFAIGSMLYVVISFQEA